MSRGEEGLSGKVEARHRERLAVVYVRQSTVQQVQRHQESTRLQYGLVATAERLGWPRERVLVIDEDLGVSGASAEGRTGFQRLLGEVALDHVGLILGVEMSRLARSCKDWYQLLELCAVFGTLIGDLDGVYDPARYNDRLLLGLKGTMSEAELHVLKQRMLQGKMAKARRGELGKRVPVGYVRRPSGEVAKDPDEGVRGVVERIFELFERAGGPAARTPIRASGWITFRAARWISFRAARASSSRNFPRKTRPRTFTGRKKPGRHGTHREPSRESPPPGTTQWTWGWWWRVWPQVCRTETKPTAAPRCRGSAATSRRVPVELNPNQQRLLKLAEVPRSHYA